MLTRARKIMIAGPMLSATRAGAIVANFRTFAKRKHAMTARAIPMRMVMTGRFTATKPSVEATRLQKPHGMPSSRLDPSL